VLCLQCTPNPDVARQMDFPFIILFVIFGGFLIPYNEIPDWLIWVFWISPLSWGVRSLALNEYGGSRYDDLQANTNTREGDYYLQQFDVNTNQQYKWAGIGYLLGFFLTFSLVSSYAITNVRAGGSLGTKRLPAVDSKAAKEAGLQVANGAVVNSAGNPVQPAVTDTVASAVGSAATAVGSSVGAPMGAAISTTNSAAGRDPLMVPPQVGAHLSVPISVAPKQMSSRGKSSFQMTGMPFTPVTLAWRDIHYYVASRPSPSICSRASAATASQAPSPRSWAHQAPARPRSWTSSQAGRPSARSLATSSSTAGPRTRRASTT
jgi:hypothetical protein